MDYESDETLDAAAQALLEKFRRMAEAGVVPPMAVWDKDWGTLAQNLWLQARQDVFQAKVAFASQVFADSIGLAMLEGPPQGGALAEDIVMDRLPESTQDALTLNRLKRKALAEAMLAATGE